jgi:RNA polymerase sigma factor (sigma-70 family)
MPDKPSLPDAMDWDDLYLRLVAATRYLLNGRSVPGMDIDDLIHDAFMKYLGGLRHWDPSNATFFQFMCGVIRSDISHSLASIEATSTSAITDAMIIRLSDQRATPEEAEMYVSEQAALLDFLEKEDPFLRRMAELLYQHGSLPLARLSRIMAVSVPKAYRLRLRLRLLVKRYQDTQTRQERLK